MNLFIMISTMIRLLILLITINLTVGMHGQDIDSLKVASFYQYYENEQYEQAIVIGTELLNKTGTASKDNEDYLNILSTLADCHYYSGEIDKAIELGIQVLEIRRELFGENNLDYGNSLDDLAHYYYDFGDYHKAIEFGTQAMEICKNILGAEHSYYATSIHNLAVYHSMIGNHTKAIELETQSLEIQKKNHGEEHSEYANALGVLANCYSKLGDFTKAIELETMSLNIQKKIHDENTPNYATSLNNISLYYYELGNYANAIEFGNQALIIRRNLLGMDHPRYANTLHNLASYYNALCDYSKAIELEKQTLAIRERIFGKEHPDYTVSLSSLAAYYSNLGDYSKSIELGTQALDIQRNAQGEWHPALATTLINLATTYYYLCDYSKAIELGTQALEVQKKTLGEEHPDFINSLNRLSLFYNSLGDHIKALEIITQALKTQRTVLGEENPDYVSSLFSLATDYSRLGDYTKAIEMKTKAIEIQRKVLGEDHLDYVSSLSSLAKDYSKLGDYTKAIEIETKALEIQRAVLGEDHPNYVSSLFTLVAYYSEHGDYTKAKEIEAYASEILKRDDIKDLDPQFYGENNELMDSIRSKFNQIEHQLFISQEPVSYERYLILEDELLQLLKKSERDQNAFSMGWLAYYNSYLGHHERAVAFGIEAVEISKKIFGTEHPYYVRFLADLAGYYSNLGDYQEAVRLGTEAVDVTQRVRGTKNQDYVRYLTDLAGYYSNLGDNKEAIRLETEAIQIRKRTIGIEGPDYVRYLADLAGYYSNLGDYFEALPLIKEYLNLVRKDTYDTFSRLTANERFMYWNHSYYIINLNNIPRILVHSGMPDAATMLYDYMALFAKSVLLSTEQEMEKLIQESDNAEALQMYSQLRQYRQILNAQYLKPISERQINCDSLEKVSTELERQLVSRVKEFGDYTRNLSITWHDVQSKLNDNDIAIEFLSYSDIDGGTTYAALTLCKGDTMPMLTPLFVESQLNTASSIQDTYLTPITDAIVWGGLSSRLQGKSHVYFSASGMLHNIGIEYLPSMKGKECYRLSSTRELVTHKPSERRSKSAALFGGIDYDATYASLKSTVNNEPSATYLADNTMTIPVGLNRGGFNYSTMRGTRYAASRLPHSKPEIQEISAFLKENGFVVQDFDTIRATEESFKALSGQRKSLIHISTHGFYYDEDEAENKAKHMRMMLMGENRPTNIEDQSLLRCGLCFAGANQILQDSLPSSGQDDGILNALEIAQMDLRGLDLVVLSACQTALGDVVNGEGVFGLQRGFKKAGANSILMSLWEVDDEVTHIFMTEFYRAWTSGMTKTQAMKKAQAIIQERYPDPHDWAAFILLDALD